MCLNCIANLLMLTRDSFCSDPSGDHLDGLVLPGIKCIGSGVAGWDDGEAIAARAKDGVDLIMRGQKSRCLSGDLNRRMSVSRFRVRLRTH